MPAVIEWPHTKPHRYERVSALNSTSNQNERPPTVEDKDTLDMCIINIRYSKYYADILNNNSSIPLSNRIVLQPREYSIESGVARGVLHRN